MTEKIVNNIKIERMISKFTKEDQNNILKELNEIKDIASIEVIDTAIVSLIIYYYFKFQKIN